MEARKIRKRKITKEERAEVPLSYKGTTNKEYLKLTGQYDACKKHFYKIRRAGGISDEQIYIQFANLMMRKQRCYIDFLDF
ncbi:MAG: hypothetical protein LBF04_00885 [Prevotellaceae bacterium]|jgi:hypothetical protein|nr:hypothetical protein [Prevotellaceae bacterium]